MSKKDIRKKEYSDADYDEDIDASEQELDDKTINIAKKYGRIVLISLLVLLPVIAIYFYWKNSEYDKTVQASAALSRIADKYKSSDYMAALYGDSTSQVRGEDVIGLIEITEDYEGTPPGKLAALYAGDSFLSMNKPDEAKDYFEMAIKANSNIVAIGGNAGYAACMEQSGDSEAAAEHYNKAVNLTSQKNLKARYEYYAALNFEKAGSKEQAAALYIDIINSIEYSEFADLSKLALLRVGTEIE